VPAGREGQEGAKVSKTGCAGYITGEVVAKPGQQASLFYRGTVKERSSNMTTVCFAKLTAATTAKSKVYTMCGECNNKRVAECPRSIFGEVHDQSG
jgi:hypothetical protein